MSDLVTSFDDSTLYPFVRDFINAQTAPGGGPKYASTNEGWEDLVNTRILPLVMGSPQAPPAVLSARAAQAAANAYLNAAMNPGITSFVGFKLAAPNISVAAGSSGTVTLTVTFLGSFVGTVALTSIAPSGVTVGFGTTPLMASGTSVITVTVVSGANNGTFNIGIIGDDSVGTRNIISIALTVTGGVSSGTFTNGPFSATNPGAMTVGTAYNLTLQWTLPSGLTLGKINFWSVWFVPSASAPNNSTGIAPPPNCPAADFNPNTNLIYAWQVDGITVDQYVMQGTSGNKGNSLWTMDTGLTQMTVVGSNAEVAIFSAKFLAPGTYDLYMRVNYQDPLLGSVYAVDAVQNQWFDLGTYIAS